MRVMVLTLLALITLAEAHPPPIGVLLDAEPSESVMVLTLTVAGASVSATNHIRGTLRVSQSVDDTGARVVFEEMQLQSDSNYLFDLFSGAFKGVVSNLTVRCKPPTPIQVPSSPQGFEFYLTSVPGALGGSASYESFSSLCDFFMQIGTNCANEVKLTNSFQINQLSGNFDSSDMRFVAAFRLGTYAGSLFSIDGFGEVRGSGVIIPKIEVLQQQTPSSITLSWHDTNRFDMFELWQCSESLAEPTWALVKPADIISISREVSENRLSKTLRIGERTTVFRLSR